MADSDHRWKIFLLIVTLLSGIIPTIIINYAHYTMDVYVIAFLGEYIILGAFSLTAFLATMTIMEFVGERFKGGNLVGWFGRPVGERAGRIGSVFLGFGVAITFLTMQQFPWIVVYLNLFTIGQNHTAIQAIYITLFSANTIPYAFSLLFLWPAVRHRRPYRYRIIAPPPSQPLPPKPPPTVSRTLQDRIILREDIQEPVSEDAKPSCIVCKNPIAPGATIIKCPHCKGRAHKHHMEQWLATQRTCPLCRRKL